MTRYCFLWEHINKLYRQKNLHQNVIGGGCDYQGTLLGALLATPSAPAKSNPNFRKLSLQLLRWQSKAFSNPINQWMVDGFASKPSLRQDTGYMVEKTYLDIAPYLRAFWAYLICFVFFGQKRPQQTIC